MARTGKLTLAETFRSLAEGIKTSAVRPNVYGYSPHEHQRIFHSMPRKNRQFVGGNRSGKTVGGAVEGVWHAMGKHPYRIVPNPPTRGRIVSVDFLNGVEKIVRPEFSRWLPPSALKNGSWSDSYNKELRLLTLDNGSTIEFMSNDQDLDKFAGTSRHWVWFDEEPREDIYKECLARLVDTGGCWWMTMTPVEGMTWTFDEIYLKAKTSNTIGIVEVDMTDNPYLNMGEIEEFLSNLSEDERAARVHGRYVERAGLVYKMFGNQHIIDPFMPPKDWLHFAGMDHGFNNPTAWLWGAVNGDGTIIIYDEHYVSGQIVSWHAQRVHERNKEHDRVPDYYVGDPSIRNVDPITGTSVLIEYIEHGIPIILGNNDQKAGINRVATLLTGREVPGENRRKPQLYITRNCTNLISELTRLRWAQWATAKMRQDKNDKEEQHKKNDHAADALRYMVASRPQMDTGKEIPEKSIPVGASIAVDPDTGYVDNPSRVLGRTVTADFTLGSEF